MNRALQCLWGYWRQPGAIMCYIPHSSVSCFTGISHILLALKWVSCFPIEDVSADLLLSDTGAWPFPLLTLLLIVEACFFIFLRILEFICVSNSSWFNHFYLLNNWPGNLIFKYLNSQVAFLQHSACSVGR